MNTKLFLIATSLLMVMNGVNVGYTMEESMEKSEQNNKSQYEQYDEKNNENDENNNMNINLNINEFPRYKNKDSVQISFKKNDQISVQITRETAYLKQMQQKINNDYELLNDEIYKDKNKPESLVYYEREICEIFESLQNKLTQPRFEYNMFSNVNLNSFDNLNLIINTDKNILNHISDLLYDSQFLADEAEKQIQLLELSICLHNETIKFLNIIPNSLKKAMQELVNVYTMIINAYRNDDANFYDLLAKAINEKDKIFEKIDNIIDMMDLDSLPKLDNEYVYYNFFVAYYNVKYKGHHEKELIHALIPILCNGRHYEMLEKRLLPLLSDVLKYIEECATKLFQTPTVQKILELNNKLTDRLNKRESRNNNNDNYEKYNNNKHIQINQNNNNYKNNFNKYNNENGNSNYNNNFNNTINQYNESEDDEYNNNESFHYSNNINNFNSFKNNQFNKRNKYPMNLNKRLNNFNNKKITTQQGREFEEAFEFVANVKEGKNQYLKYENGKVDVRKEHRTCYAELKKYNDMQAKLNNQMK